MATTVVSDACFETKIRDAVEGCHFDRQCRERRTTLRFFGNRDPAVVRVALGRPPRAPIVHAPRSQSTDLENGTQRVPNCDLSLNA